MSSARRAKFILLKVHISRAFVGLLAAIDAVEAALRLIAAAVVVDHGHRIDVPARRGFDLGDVIPEAGIAGEGHDRPVRAGAFGAESGRERPAEMAGAAHIALPRRGQIEHAAHPHAGMAGVDDDDGVVRHVPRQFVAQPLRPDRHRVGFERGLYISRAIRRRFSAPRRPRPCACRAARGRLTPACAPASTLASPLTAAASG